LKIVILAAAPVAIIAAWWWNGSNERTWNQEAIESVAGVIYRVKCDKCGRQFEMPAEQYVSKFKNAGVPCPFCDSQSAYKVGEAGDDPEQFKEEMSRITTVAEVQDKLEDAEAEYAEIKRKIQEFGDLNADPERGAELRRERARLRAKVNALNMRWSEILAG